MNRPETAIPTAAPSAGILSAYHFAPDGTATPLAAGHVDEAIAAREGWFWIHLSLADTRCRNWIEHNASLSGLVRDILLGPDEHQRLDLYGRDIVGVIPDLQMEFDHHTEDLGRLRFVMTDRFLITLRRKPLHSVERTRQAIAAGTRFTAPIDLLDAIIDHFADFVGKLAERLGDDLDEAEDRIWRDEAADQSQRVGRARSQAVRVHRQLSQMRNLFHRLELRLSGVLPEMIIPIRDLAHKLEAFDQTVAAIHDRARLLQEEMNTRMAAITNRRLFTLSMLTAGILPPTLVTGFFGMNTKHLPFQDVDGGTWYALGVALAAGLLTYLALQRMRAL
jgi:zinc transporter